MIKVINKNWNESTYDYVFKLANDDEIVVKEKDYNRIMLHTSKNGNVYRAIVDEHENEFEEPIEYLGFELVE